MALKTKQDDFKNIAGETDINGAPFFANDFIRLQQNSNADFINDNEYYRSKLPEMLIFHTALPLVKKFENGLILSGFEYDNTNPAAPVISEGYFLSGGNVCYYPGATIAAGANPTLLYLYKGADTFVNRTFDDGGNKEFLVVHNVVQEIGEITGSGPVMQAGTGITATDEVIVITCGNVASTTPRYAEARFTKDAALRLLSFGNQLDQNQWTDAGSFLAGVTVDTDRFSKMVSRLNNQGFTEIAGSVNLNGLPAGLNTLMTLGASNLTSVSGIVPIPCALIDSGNIPIPYMAYVNPVGQVTINSPGGGIWASGDTKIHFDCKILGVVQTQYEYDSNFLDIT